METKKRVWLSYDGKEYLVIKDDRIIGTASTKSGHSYTMKMNNSLYTKRFSDINALETYVSELNQIVEYAETITIK